MYSKFLRLQRFSSKTNSIYNLLSLQYDILIWYNELAWVIMQYSAVPNLCLRYFCIWTCTYIESTCFLEPVWAQMWTFFCYWVMLAPTTALVGDLFLPIHMLQFVVTTCKLTYIQWQICVFDSIDKDWCNFCIRKMWYQLYSASCYEKSHCVNWPLSI